MLFKTNELTRCISAIKQGKVAVFPFDTLMGLTAIINAENCRRIHAIKQRDDQPFIVILPDMDHLSNWVVPLPASIHQYLEHYWPGPITFICHKKDNVPDYVTAGKPTIAIRICDFFPVNTLMQSIEEPVLSTSANRHGMRVASSIEDCDPDILAAADAAFDGCRAYYNQPSTIVDLTASPPTVLRQGVINFEPQTT